MTQAEVNRRADVLTLVSRELARSIREFMSSGDPVPFQDALRRIVITLEREVGVFCQSPGDA